MCSIWAVTLQMCVFTSVGTTSGPRVDVVVVVLVDIFPTSRTNFFSGAAAYQLGNTSSRTITEVKQRWARLVLGWETV